MAETPNFSPYSAYPELPPPVGGPEDGSLKKKKKKRPEDGGGAPDTLRRMTSSHQVGASLLERLGASKKAEDDGASSGTLLEKLANKPAASDEQAQQDAAEPDRPTEQPAETAQEGAAADEQPERSTEDATESARIEALTDQASASPELADPSTSDATAELPPASATEGEPMDMPPSEEEITIDHTAAELPGANETGSTEAAEPAPADENVTAANAAAPTAGGGAGGGTPPPTRPRTSWFNGGPGWFRNRNQGGMPANPNAAPQPVVVQRARFNLPLILASYWLGRRGGRRAAERHLKPQIELAQTEAQAAQNREASARAEMAAQQINHEDALRTVRSEAERAQAETLASAAAAPQTEALHPTPAREQTASQSSARQGLEKPESRARLAKVVDLMPREDVLKIAQEIPIADSNARELYARGEVGDAGIRDIVRAWLEGNYDMQQVIDTEVRRYELDRQLRSPWAHKLTSTTLPADTHQSGVEPVESHAAVRETAVPDNAPAQTAPKQEQEPVMTRPLAIANIIAGIVIMVVVAVLVIMWLKR